MPNNDNKARGSSSRAAHWLILAVPAMAFMFIAAQQSPDAAILTGLYGYLALPVIGLVAVAWVVYRIIRATNDVRAIRRVLEHREY